MTMNSLKIGVLAVQGAFIEHEKIMDALGAKYVELRQASDVSQSLDGIILPGGESSVQGKLLRELGMFENLKALIQKGIPVLATCAGMILLATSVTQGIGSGDNSLTQANNEEPLNSDESSLAPHLSKAFSSNQFGGSNMASQDFASVNKESSQSNVSAPPYFATFPMRVRRNAFGRQLGSFSANENYGQLGEYPMVFIRGPIVEKIDSDAKTLATSKGNIVAAQYKNQTALAFHPELTRDTRIHEQFFNLAKEVRG